MLEPPEDDGDFIPEVSPHTLKKHHFLERYINIFSTGMKNRWPRRLYIDLFASAGIQRVRGNGLTWGSPLIAAQAKDQFTELHLCEKSSRSCEALRQRIAQFPQPTAPRLTQGDANEIIQEIVSSFPRRSFLGMAFLDPYGMHLSFETVKVLAQWKIDLIIFFPDRLDVLRNWSRYEDDPDSNLDRAFGTTEWRTVSESLDSRVRLQQIRELYKNQIRNLGYDWFDHKRISGSANRPFYLLIYCSKDKAGLRFWREACKTEHGGQLYMDM